MQLFAELYRILRLTNIEEKCRATQNLAALVVDTESDVPFEHEHAVHAIDKPGLPSNVELVAPRQLKRRGMQAQSGRNILMHAIAHIEFNAINLALDAAYRFRDQPLKYYQDWISVAADEARHFNLIKDYLNTHDCDYGDFPAHNGLWDMAVQTADDVIARMALVPRVLEARGLDVTPTMIEKLQNVGDQAAVDILRVIYQDEIGHVKIGSHWFNYHCEQQQLDSRQTFKKMVDKHLHGQLKGPFNLAARLQAGFDEIELANLDSQC